MLDRERVLPEWLKTAASVIAAAVAAYWGIRIDLVGTMKDVSYLQDTARRHEVQIEKLRDDVTKASAMPQGPGVAGAGAALRAR